MSKYAYVTVLYGNNIYLTGALVLGYSLWRTRTKLDRVILVTPDVSSEYRNYLKELYTHVIEIEYVSASPNIFLDPNTRFRDVFTKLQCFTLIQYEKVLLLDLDMIVAKNIDHLFKLDAPAACIKRLYVPYGKKIPGKMICDGDKLVGSINAGVMLLQPNMETWDFIKKDIQKPNQPHQYRYPEQDYLSLFYCDQWTSITFNYNFQFGLTRRVKRSKYKIHNIYIIHYSSSLKPWNMLETDYQPSPEEIKFQAQHQKYYTLWDDAYQNVKNKYQKQGITLPY